MACTGRYAEAWEFASFWCIGSLLAGLDNSGGAGNAFLTDSGGNFLARGVQANVGMIIYNTTDGSSGQVTAVTNTTVTATLAGGAGNDWDNGDGYRMALINGAEIATIEHYLNIAAGDLHAALAAVGACDCTLAGWATNFLAKLNIIDAAVYHHCPCGQPKMSDRERGDLLGWMNDQMAAIRTGKVDVCAGATGADYPWGDAIQYSLTAWNEAQLIINQLRRTA